MARENTLEEAKNLNGALGDHLEVEFTSNMYASQVTMDVELGDVWESDSKSASASWDSDAEERIAESIVLNLNGEIYDVPSEYVNFINTYEDGIEFSAQIELDFLDRIRGKDFSTAQIELDLRNVSDLSENGTYQEGTVLRFVADEHSSGRTKRLQKVNDSVQSLASGDDQFEIRQNGDYSMIVLEDQNGVLDHVTAEAVLPGDEVQIIDESTTSLRNRNVRNAGTTSLDSSYYLIDVRKAGVDSENVDYLDFEVETNSSGSVRAWTTTVRQAE